MAEHLATRVGGLDCVVTEDHMLAERIVPEAHPIKPIGIVAVATRGCQLVEIVVRPAPHVI